MKKMASLCALVFCFLIAGCTENYSNGERIGMVTQFAKAGVFWKSYEGHLNATQTGMNSSVPFDFSIDNDHEEPLVVTMLDSAANLGWKVKLTYHKTIGKNWFSNRGTTDYFVTKVDVLDRDPASFLRGNQATSSSSTGAVAGRAIDTVFVVIIGRTSEGFKR